MGGYGAVSTTGVRCGFRTRNGAVSTTGEMFATGAAFDRTTRFAGDLFGFLDCLNQPPFVCRGLPVCRQIRQPEKVRLAIFATAGAPRSGQFDKAQGADLADAGADSVPPNPIFFEIGERDRQLAVVFATVVRKLDLDAGSRIYCG
jgi:hypothetical protein